MSSRPGNNKRTSLYVGLVITLGWMSLALLVPFLPLHSPYAIDLSGEYAEPSLDHLLGRGENGVDVLSQLLWGARTSLRVALLSASFSALVGILLGASAGYFRGRIDRTVSFVIDVVYAFPGVLLVVALAAFLGPAESHLIFALCLSAWAGFARMARANALSASQWDFVNAAKALGLPPWRILLFHVCPHLFGPMFVQFVLSLSGFVLLESSLSYLGLGLSPEVASWGQLIRSGREVMTSAIHLVVAPSLALTSLVVGFLLLTNGMRAYIDPQFR